MKNLKQIVLLAVLLVTAACSFGQITSVNWYLESGQCLTNNSTPNNYTFDSIQVHSGPSHGTFTDSVSSFVYCADSGFVGVDTVWVNACAYNGVFFVGCSDFYLIFNVSPACNLAVALVEDSGVCAGGNRHYATVVTGGSAPYSYLWTDNSMLSGACELNPGQGNCVEVTDNAGCHASACSNANGCNLAITINQGVCGGPLSSLGVTISGGVPQYTFLWSNGSTGDVICNLNPGYYTVTVTDANNCSATATYFVAGAGGCSFSAYPTTPVLPNQFAFTGIVDSAYTPIAWLWTFGDAADTTTASVQNPTHTYPGAGYYYVTMKVWYSNGDSCFYNQDIFVQGDSLNNPQCQAYYYTYMDSAGAYYFSDASAYNIIGWLWDFGDGTSATLQNPVHQYNTTGNWTVCLTVSSASGCTSNFCQQLSNVPVQDVEANLFHHTTVTPGFPVWVYLGYYNLGTVLMNGTVVYKYPYGTTVNATSQTPVAHDVLNRTLTFNYSGLMPGASGYIHVDLDADPSLVLGSLAQDTLWVNPIAGDQTPENNISVVSDSVVGSWDPNDKAVSPKGEGAHGLVPLSTNELSYRIRFQNTGSAPAQTVKIRDIISNNIDLTTVKVSGASHAHTFEIIGNELVVTFDNINLVDSGADYEASQGYIDVHVNLKPGLANGTQIFNTADIYFDFNAPVITNTVVTTLGSFVSGINDAVNFDFAVMPNPANNQVALRGEFEKGATYELMNQLGQVVLAGPVTTTNTVVNVADLNSGIYLVRIKSGSKTGVQRLIVAK